MKKSLNKIIILALLVLLSSNYTYAKNVIGIEIQESYKNSLALNGAGVRSKWFFDLYVASLYLESKSSDAMGIVNSDKKMNLRLRITSSMITSEKMKAATHEGFENSTNNNTNNIQSKIDKFINVFDDEIKENDVYDFYYEPKVGVQIYKNEVLVKKIESMEFKKALFGIWLGENPAQDTLKNELLGLE